jgi:anti-sigma regulatory factor (Ser/Thr protein kinase)
MTSSPGPERPQPSARDRPGAEGEPDGRLDLRIQCSPAGPGIARRALAHWAADLPVRTDVLDDAVLIVSELVTNAVVHARSDPRLSARLAHDCLRLEVHDTSADAPIIAVGTSAGGYGMQLVADLAHAWGWAPTPSGKVVWTEQCVAI